MSDWCDHCRSIGNKIQWENRSLREKLQLMDSVSSSHAADISQDAAEDFRLLMRLRQMIRDGRSHSDLLAEVNRENDGE